jgi:hypothetical protein
MLLDVGATKNGDGRTVKMTDEVYELIKLCVQGKGPNDYVFTRPDGKPVKDFRAAWRNACVRAGVGRWLCRLCSHPILDNKCPKCGQIDPKYKGLIVHDLRRTGARNLRRLGVAEGTIMKIGGWKTASVFRRYDITDEADLEAAAERLNQKRQKLALQQTENQARTQEFGHDFGHELPENDASVESRPTASIN